MKWKPRRYTNLASAHLHVSLCDDCRSSGVVAHSSFLFCSISGLEMQMENAFSSNCAIWLAYYNNRFYHFKEQFQMWKTFHWNQQNTQLLCYFFRQNIRLWTPKYDTKFPHGRQSKWEYDLSRRISAIISDNHLKCLYYL